ncbi:MAG TPA: hypothetical protein VFH08_12345 [Chitinophagaceae bacterium]|nr:hypothetical protein [Chitinophagaceae bacterium]
MKSLLSIFYTACFLSFVIAARKKETSCEGCNLTNNLPIAVTGSDQVITLPTDSALVAGTSAIQQVGTPTPEVQLLISTMHQPIHGVQPS